jgi:hypothetical protein
VAQCGGSTVVMLAWRVGVFHAFDQRLCPVRVFTSGAGAVNGQPDLELRAVQGNI